MVEIVQKHCPTVLDAIALVTKLVEKCREFLPGLSLDNTTCTQLLSSLGSLRQGLPEMFRWRQIQQASLSVAQIDRAVCALPFKREALEECGYQIGEVAYRHACSSSPANSSSSPAPVVNKGGRPSKVNNPDIHSLVRNVIAKYLKESERIIVVGRGERRKMLLAQHLSQTRFSIYKAETELQHKMSMECFRQILKLHFPFVKNPRRLTDICQVAAYGNFSVLTPGILKR